jgi:hypothetical protein
MKQLKLRNFSCIIKFFFSRPPKRFLFLFLLYKNQQAIQKIFIFVFTLQIMDDDVALIFIGIQNL